MDDPEFLRVKQAAKIMQVGRDTAYRMAKEGKIPSLRIGHQIRIPRKALIDHLERQANGQVTEGAT